MYENVFIDPGFSWRNNAFSSSSFSPVDKTTFGTSKSLGTASTAGSGMWPLALASLGSTALGGVFSGMQAQREAETMAKIESARQQEASRARGIAGMQGMFNAAVAPEFEYMMQSRAREKELREFQPYEGLLASEGRRRQMREMLSPEANALFQREQQANLNQALVERQASLAGMFGPTKQFARAFG